MTPEHTQQLFDAFPRLYRGRAKPAQESMMASGFSCSDGWFALIWQLSQAIEQIAQQEGLDACGQDWPEAMQVKQKCGTLRFRLKNPSAGMTALVQAAETTSETVCEACGMPVPHESGTCPE